MIHDTRYNIARKLRNTQYARKRIHVPIQSLKSVGLLDRRLDVFVELREAAETLNESIYHLFVLWIAAFGICRVHGLLFECISHLIGTARHVLAEERDLAFDGGIELEHTP